MLRGRHVLLRPWQAGDEEPLVRHANDRAVWRNLTDRFPHPYGRADAVAWIRQANEHDPPCHLAVVVDGAPVGGAGFERLPDLGRRTAEIGYWLGASHWGRGLATEALGLMTDYAFAHFDFVRLQAGVLDWNPASRRVLEKVGYHLEARLARSVSKDDQLIDSWLYVRLRD